VRSVALAVLVRPASALARGTLGVELARRTLWEERRPLAVLVRTAAAFTGKAVAVEHAGTSVGKALGRGAPGNRPADHGGDETGDERFHALLLAAATKSGCYLHRRSPSRQKCLTRPLLTPCHAWPVARSRSRNHRRMKRARTTLVRVGARPVELLKDARNLEREARNACLEHLAGLGVHLVGAFHRAERRREHGAAGVAMHLAARERRLLPDHARGLHLLDVSVAIGDDPVPAAELGARGALVRDRDRVGEGEAALVGGRAIGQVRRLHRDTNSVGQGR